MNKLNKVMMEFECEYCGHVFKHNIDPDWTFAIECPECKELTATRKGVKL